MENSLLATFFFQVIFSTGFCVLAGDLGSQLALGAISNHASNSNEPVALDAWLEGYDGGVSAGVIHTAEAMKKAQFPKDREFFSAAQFARFLKFAELVGVWEVLIGPQIFRGGSKLMLKCHG